MDRLPCRWRVLRMGCTSPSRSKGRNVSRCRVRRAEHSLKRSARRTLQQIPAYRVSF
jgi:hypothetical protein